MSRKTAKPDSIFSQTPRKPLSSSESSMPESSKTWLVEGGINMHDRNRRQDQLQPQNDSLDHATP